jgi:metal-responsive CopG/Arc/MetJ family transcriptional regulator
MPTRPVQISIDDALLEQIDGDEETRAHGRSAFVRAAIRLYLRAKERRAIDTAILRAYDGMADELLAEVEALLEAQAWPAK